MLAWLEDLARASDQPVTSDLVAAEVYFALQLHYRVPKGKAWAALRRMLEEGEVGTVGAVTDVLRNPGLANAKPGFVDRLIHAEYRSEGGGGGRGRARAARIAPGKIRRARGADWIGSYRLSLK